MARSVFADDVTALDDGTVAAVVGPLAVCEPQLTENSEMESISDATTILARNDRIGAYVPLEYVSTPGAIDDVPEPVKSYRKRL